MTTTIRENEQKALSDLLPSANLTTEEKAALVNWNSNPPVYPDLTVEETEKAIRDARMQKGQQQFSEAYAKKTKGIRMFPVFTAKEFREFIVKRGKGRALDAGWDDFIINSDNQPILKILSLYFTRDERFLTLKKGYSFRKGIMLIGKTGVGKTVLMELFQLNPFVPFIPCKCKNVVAEYSKEKTGGQQIIDQYSNNLFVDSTDTDYTFGHQTLGRMFDDLGQEALGKHYTREANVMEDILENRYNAGDFFRTHITSNHTIDQFRELYGPRVEDRCHEMFNVVEYPATAKSFRRS